MNYKYIGDRVLIFSNLNGRSLKAIPGESYDFDADPNDSRFVASAGEAPAASSTAVEPPAVSGGETPSSPPDPLDEPPTKDEQ